MSKSMEDSLAQIIEKLKTERDELRVKAHLAKMEAQEEWEALESKWQDLESRMNQIGSETKDTSRNFLEASESLAHELADAFRHFRNRLK